MDPSGNTNENAPKRNKDNISWRYCLTMMLLCFMTGGLVHSIWVQYMDSRHARVWEADKMQTLDRCSRMTKLALAITSTTRPGTPELEKWFSAQTAVGNVPTKLLQDYEDWQVLRATNAVVAQLEYFELRNKLPETDLFREEFESFGEIIKELYADTGRPVGAE